MLSAFTARAIIELKPKEKNKIESLLAHGDRLLVGLNNGCLRVYRVNGPNPDADQERPASREQAVQLLKEQERFSKHRIEQLAIIKEANILLSLSNGLVSIHDLSSYELQESFTNAKGASVFAVTSNIVNDAATGVPGLVSRLAIAVKRRLMLWAWHDSELSMENPEFTLLTGIKSLTWVTGTRLVAGLTSSFVLVDVETSEVTDIVGPGSIGGAPGQDSGRFGGVGAASMGYMGMGGMVPKPLVTRLSEGQVLLARDINTHFVDTDGNSLGRKQIPWPIAPEAIGYSYPFLLALHSGKGYLEVRNPETLGALQTVGLPHATMMHVPNPYVSLAHAGKGFLVSSEKCVWRMDALGYDAQIQSLMDIGKFDEAISLLGLLEDALLSDKDGRVREAKMLKAQELFDHRKYRESLDLFTEASAQPERVIALFPSLISGELDTTAPSQKISQSSQNKVSGEESNNLEQDIRVSSGNEVVTKAQGENASVKSKEGPFVDKTDAASIESLSAGGSVRRRELVGKELQAATTELLGFLVDARTRLQKYINFDGTLKDNENGSNGGENGAGESLLLAPRSDERHSFQERLLETAKLVDTTLFRAYMLARPSLAGALFRLPNFCEPEVVKEKLLDSGRYVDLIDFFYGKRLHREALAMLQELGQKDDEEIPEVLRGPRRIVAYLQNLPPEMIDLILQYAEWPVDTDPVLGMDVFLADTENAETLPRDTVLSFLKKHDKRLETMYLEHVIDELNDTTPDYHQRLVSAYLEDLQTNKNQDDEHWSKVREKLLDFLRTSKHYEPWRFLRSISKEDPNLHEARAIILGTIGQHRQALSIYVFDIGDAAKAEEYCNQVYVSEVATSTSGSPTRRSSEKWPEDQPSIYHDLLSLYLSPPPPREPQLGPALDILAKHGPRLPPSLTLGLIPEVLPVAKLEQYFTTRIRAANTRVNEARIVAGLHKTVDIGEEATLRLVRRNRNVLITDDRICGVCHKRFGGSAIKVMPSNSVVHYGCSLR